MVIDFIKRTILGKNKDEGIEQVDISKFPSSGLFYPVDTKISIKKADIDIQIRYFNRLGDRKSHIFRRFEAMYYVVSKCIVESNIATEEILATDIPYLFMLIIELTKGTPLYIGDVVLKKENIYHFNIDLSNYDPVDRVFISEGYKFAPIKSKHQLSISHILTEDVIKNNIKVFGIVDDIYLYFLKNVNNLTVDVLIEVVSAFSEFDTSVLNNINKAKKDLISLIFIYIQSPNDGTIYHINVYESLHDIWDFQI